MKKILSLLFIASTLLFFTSCSEDCDETIIGTWVSQEIEFNSESAPEGALELVVTEDNLHLSRIDYDFYEVAFEKDDIKAYEIEDNLLVIGNTNDPKLVSTYSHDCDELTISGLLGTAGRDVTFTRQD